MKVSSVDRGARLIFILGLVGIFTLQSSAAIFGADDRVSLTESHPKNNLARATAIAVLSSNYSVSELDQVELGTENLSQLCSNEKLYNEPSLPYACTGFLVAPDLLVTAGHCLYAINTPNREIVDESGFSCPVFTWLFDFQKSIDGQIPVSSISKSEMYHCRRVIYATQQEVSPYLDYGVIQLDRPVLGRAPLKLAFRSPNVGTSVFMIGHPFGTAKKLTENGRVILNDPLASALMTDLDAFMGNSGSPVFNEHEEVVGILVGGTPSPNTYYDPIDKCERFNRCDQLGKNCILPDADPSLFPEFLVIGSAVQRIDPIIDLMNKLNE